MIDFLIALGVTFVACFILVPIFLALVRVFCFYAVIRERQCVVFELFGSWFDELGTEGLDRQLGRMRDLWARHRGQALAA